MRYRGIALWLLVGLLLAFDAHAGRGHRHGNDDNPNDEAGLIPFIFEHATDMQITADQKERLTTLKRAYDKIMADPQVQNLLRKISDARQAGHADEVETLNKQYDDLIKKQSGGAFTTLEEAVEKLLTKDQLAKLNVLRAAANKGKRGKNGGAAPPPDATNPFGN